MPMNMDLRGRGPFDMQIKNNYNLATLSSEFSSNTTNYKTLEKTVLFPTCDFKCYKHLRKQCVIA